MTQVASPCCPGSEIRPGSQIQIGLTPDHAAGSVPSPCVGLCGADALPPCRADHPDEEKKKKKKTHVRCGDGLAKKKKA